VQDHESCQAKDKGSLLRCPRMTPGKPVMKQVLGGQEGNRGRERDDEDWRREKL
jgi:hypothetical protein